MFNLIRKEAIRLTFRYQEWRSAALAPAQEVPAMIVLVLKALCLFVAGVMCAFAWINVSERK